MEPKREVSSVDLRALGRDLQAYVGARVDKAYLYGDDLVRLKLRDFERGRIELLIEVGARKRINVAPPEYVEDAPDRPPNFARMLRNRIAGAELTGVEQYEFDRIVNLEFTRDDERVTLVAELFGDGNVAVLDAAGSVVDALETVRLKSRTVAPGSQYEYPDARLFPFGLDREGFAAHLRESDTDVVRTLATQLNLGGTYAEEICARADVERERPIAELDADTIDGLHRVLRDIGERLEQAAFEPVIVTADDDVVDVTPFRLAIHRDRSMEPFETMNDAVATYFHQLAEQQAAEDGEEGPGVADEIAKYERMIAQQESAIEEFAEEEARMRERAEALYAQYDVVDELIETVSEARESGFDWDEIRERLGDGAAQGLQAAAIVEKIHDDGTIEVSLDGNQVSIDPGAGVEHNADRLYQEAKRIAEKRAGAETALEESREEKAALERRPQEADTDPQPTEPDEPTDWLARASIPVRQPEDWFERFRWFRTSDGFLVIGGRNADQNEEIVKNYMEPGDRFVHAQAHGGPATVIKATAPNEPARDVDFPASTLREAARFAVAYSSVWKAGQHVGEAYHVSPEQVSKEPESGEYLEKGGFVIRGERTYVDDVPLEIAVGITCEPVTRVIGGPPDPIEPRTAAARRVEPGDIAQGDVAKRLYRAFREAFTDTSFVRKIASPDRIQHFLPPGGSRIVEE